MCTLLTIDKESYGPKVEKRIRIDADRNSDGFSLVLISRMGCRINLRTLDIEPVLTLLRSTDWTRMFLHSRAATQGEVRVENTHGWDSQGVIYMHNGRIEAREANLYPVDSQAIGEWLESGVDDALEFLRRQNYANVFLIDNNNHLYYVNSSRYGMLYTDNRGNYSTNRVGKIRNMCRVEQRTHALYGWLDETTAPVDATSGADKIVAGVNRYLGNGGIDRPDIVPGFLLDQGDLTEEEMLTSRSHLWRKWTA